MAMFKVSRSLAYEDLHLVKVLLGNLQQTTKEFMRWKINKSLEQDIAAARRAGDFRSVAALSKVRVANNRTDKDDEPDLEFDKIVPQNFEPTDDLRFSASSASLTCVARYVLSTSATPTL